MLDQNDVRDDVQNGHRRTEQGYCFPDFVPRPAHCSHLMFRAKESFLGTRSLLLSRCALNVSEGTGGYGSTSSFSSTCQMHKTALPH